MEILLKELTEKMEKSVNALKNAFNKIRTGRANPAILDDINVDYYGNPTLLIKHLILVLRKVGH